MVSKVVNCFTIQFDGKGNQGFYDLLWGRCLSFKPVNFSTQYEKKKIMSEQNKSWAEYMYEWHG